MKTLHEENHTLNLTTKVSNLIHFHDLTLRVVEHNGIGYTLSQTAH